ncbi:ATP synthase mitochondrial F1 complex assembly factor 2-like [Amphiura filiformis]|uniref:ATP synthase mitochondrial F1 complex assembly factor 2-like n=1 Tax=Amphiura filiformis TaxID=82378 RepID=UPI003B21D7C2
MNTMLGTMLGAKCLRLQRGLPFFTQQRWHSFRERKRFYKNVSISQIGSNKFEVNLDKRKLRTPLGNIFTVPTEPLAIAVATEWDAQKEIIKQHTMHLTSLCNTAQDNPSMRAKDKVVRGILHFLDTDTICYRLNEPVELVQFQTAEWDPMLEWINKKYDTEITSSTSIVGPQIPDSTKEMITKHLSTRSDWALVGYENTVQCLKSVVLAFALIDREITVERAVDLSNLELNYQVQRWGNVEWSHDIEYADSKARVAAASLFVHLVTEQTKKISKSSLL